MHMITIGNKRTDAPQAGDVYVGRPSPLGNPYVLSRDGDRATVIARYRRWLTAQLCEGPGNPAYDACARLFARAQGQPLRLMCYCAPQACHGEVIVEAMRAWPPTHY